MNTSTIYAPADWNNYANNHVSVSTCFQSELYRDVANRMYGSVADFGCGSGKFAPYLCGNAKVHAYCGIDASLEMTQVAQSLVDALNIPKFNICHRYIESINPEDLDKFDSGLSINSFYAWDKPTQNLKKISELLAPKATFVLATPNSKLNMEALLRESRKDLIAHPQFPLFEQQNLSFANNPNAHFIDMDELVVCCQKAGFKLVKCHQDYFLGGLNFLVLENY